MFRILFVFSLLSPVHAADLKTDSLPESPVWLTYSGYKGLKSQKPEFASLIGTWERVAIGNRWEASYGTSLCRKKYIRFVDASTGNHLEVSNCDRTEKSIVRNVSVVRDDFAMTQGWEATEEEQTFGFEGTYHARYGDSDGEIRSEVKTGSLSYNGHPVVTLRNCKFYLPVYIACVTSTGDTQFDDDHAIFVSRSEIDKENPMAIYLQNAHYSGTDEINELLNRK
jgi:hypothetical protein